MVCWWWRGLAFAKFSFCMHNDLISITTLTYAIFHILSGKTAVNDSGFKIYSILSPLHCAQSCRRSVYLRNKSQKQIEPTNHLSPNFPTSSISQSTVLTLFMWQEIFAEFFFFALYPLACRHHSHQVG